MKISRRGLIATIIYHGLLLALMIFAGLTFPDPPPEEEGILVNFGTDDSGFGQFEPSGDEENAGDPDLPVVQESTVAETAPPEPSYTEPVAKPDQTQDLEETRVVETPKPDPKEIERQRIEKERIERERRQEQERLERERIERERIERERLEQERIAREREKKARRLNNMGRSAFGKKGVGEGDGSQGVAGGSGNQGVSTGSAGADNYGTGGGLGNNAGNYGLGDRKALGSLPKPNVSGCSVTQRIVVKVEIKVDRNGKVISAVVTEATYQDNCIWNTVVAAAKRSRFTMDQNAPYQQTGWIRYIIEP